jgi:hypothetical protein
MLVPGDPTVGDAVNVRRVVGFRVVVVVVLDGRDVLVTTRVVDVARDVVVVGSLVVCAWATHVPLRTRTTPRNAPSTTWARRVRDISTSANRRRTYTALD